MAWNRSGPPWVVSIDGPGVVVYVGTWASRPAASDVTAGSLMEITDYGAGGRSYWWSDGTYWRPQNGSVRLFTDFVTADPTANSLASLTGNSTEQFFTLPAGNLLIPAGMVNVPDARVTVEFYARRAGATGAAANVRAYISDSAAGTLRATVSQQSMTLVDGAMLTPQGQIRFGAGSTPAMAQRSLPNQVATTAGWETSASILSSENLYILFGIQSTWTADVCHLLGYDVTLQA